MKKTFKKITENNLRAYRKYHYWRGFFVCLALIMLPVLLFLIIWGNIFINNNI